MANLFGKLLLLLIFGPLILVILAHWAIVLSMVVLPWILATAAIAGVAAGLTAGLVIRHCPDCWSRWRTFAQRRREASSKPPWPPRSRTPNECEYRDGKC